MKPAAFEYTAPRSLDEALAALADGGEDAKPLAGGQSLVPLLNMRFLRPSLLVDLNRAGLDGIAAENGAVRVGAMTRQAALERSELVRERLPLVARALPFVGHVATRNRGTVGGSVAHADASAELPLCLVALGGTVVAASPAGRREIPAEDFFVLHYQTTLEPGELLVETVWPARRPGEGFAFEELALRAGDYALSMCAVRLRRDGGVARDVRVALGAVTDRAQLVETGLEGEIWSLPLVREAAQAVARALEPAGSIHATPAYLRHVTAVLVERALLAAREDAA